MSIRLRTRKFYGFQLFAFDYGRKLKALVTFHSDCLSYSKLTFENLLPLSSQFISFQSYVNKIIAHIKLKSLQ